MEPINNGGVRRRLFITLVALSVIWMLSAGPIALVELDKLRSVALKECIGEKFSLFQYCYEKTNSEFSFGIWTAVTPFIPVTLLIWTSWLLKLDVQAHVSTSDSKFRRLIVVAAYVAGSIGCLLPFVMILQREVDELRQVSLGNLLVVPWLVATWIAAPLAVQKLLDREKLMNEFRHLNKLLVIVVASPFVAAATGFIRQVANL